jgi:hypothetical protein
VADGLAAAREQGGGVRVAVVGGAGEYRVGPGGRGRHDGHVRVEEINIGPSEALLPVESVSALAGKGLTGDRHFREQGVKPGEALTLIEAEALEDVGLTGAQSRRQVVVRGVRLSELIGRRFRVGEVECLGVKLCEPCLHLQQMTRPGIIKDLIHRGGLNADILADGQIRVGDPVSVSYESAQEARAGATYPVSEEVERWASS